MPTRFYIPATAEAVSGFTPAVDAGWEYSASLSRRNVSRTSSIADAMATLSVTDPDDDTSDRDYVLLQSISLELTAGQTITGGQAIKAQFRVSETDLGNNLFLALGIRVIAANGSTVQKTVLAVTRDNVEAATTLTNRQFSATSDATNYTTVAGDRLVFEIGMGGDPTSSRNHSFTIRFGDAAGSDLAEDDTSTTDNNPWVQLNDTLTFGASGSPGALVDGGLVKSKLVTGRLVV